MKSIEDRFIYQLKKLNLTIEDFSKMSEISIEEIFNTITKNEVDINALLKISKALGVDFEYLATGEKDEFGNKYKIKNAPYQLLKSGAILISFDDNDISKIDVKEISNQIGEIKKFINNYEKTNGINLTLTITTNQSFINAVRLNNTNCRNDSH